MDRKSKVLHDRSNTIADSRHRVQVQVQDSLASMTSFSFEFVVGSIRTGSDRH